ncbi:MAG: amino acid ABC transporter permease [Gammaproteobacteria bacterium]|nr:amino acid ABC transporter permease [Gammaproteobacteria bacterium]NIR85025.1 amino acid ABC transporter permease [Gammaproteobacteria bacterium]NIR88292.1 amino acid ABC transporter permease [Gammaproteobacteria bacterium]NIU06072.1 amino acid ABC transporter permease [Gammaproteobacteria bacterium]NIV73491.1 ABC transporter permease subunit [Gammaproteobacteria bacterium]
MIDFLAVYAEHWDAWWPQILPAVGVTIALMVGAYALSVLLGILLALGKVSKVTPVRLFATAYVEVARSVPALAVLFLVYFGLVPLGIALDAFTAGVVGLALCHGGYMGEVFRGGLEALHKGQREAALAVGLTPFAAFRHILLPQAVRIVLPPALNMLIVLLRDTSLCYFISTPELMLKARDLTSTYFLPLHLYVLAGAIYFAIGFPLALAARRIGARLRRGLRET